jgi:dolichol-phosphate mannosyltransferase
MMLDTTGERFEYEMRLFGKLSDLGESLEQVPIKTIYIESNRTSHFRPVRDTVRVYQGLFGGRFLKFVGSSFAGFLVDNGVFALLVWALASFPYDRKIDILFALVLARVVSASVNYLLNRFLVFNSKSRKRVSAVKYVALALPIMALSYLGTAVLSWLFDMHGILITAIKIFVDLVLFVLSYKFQKLWVFK